MPVNGVYDGRDVFFRKRIEKAFSSKYNFKREVTIWLTTNAVFAERKEDESPKQTDFASSNCLASD